MAKEATQLSEIQQAAADQSQGTVKRRRASGPRRPSPIYVFVKPDANGKPSIAAIFRDPRKMASYFSTSKEEGSELLVVTPE